MRIASVAAILAFTLTTSHAAPSRKMPADRLFSVGGFKGRVGVHQLAGDRVAILVRNAHGTTADTVRGHTVFPVRVGGRKQPFYFGKFGASRFPMLIFAVTDPDRIQDSHVMAYQVSPSGALIGQQVIVDESTRHGHTDDVSGGRYQLAAVHPSLGAIYSVSYQDAKFDGFFVSYEKLRVRQWDPTINAFIETDQGFLREKNGKLVESAKFHSLDDRHREEVFAANVSNEERPASRPRAATRVLPVSLSQQTSKR